MLDIILVNWNSGHQLHDALASIEQYHGGFVNSVVVVDNNSSDKSIEKIDGFLAEYPCRLVVISNQTNKGFGAGCNQGAFLCRSDYLLFLNPDATLFKDTLEKSIGFMNASENTHFGVCGVQLIDRSGEVSRTCSRFPSLLGFASHALGLSRFWPSLGHLMAEWDHSASRSVDQVIGAFFLVRGETFRQLGGFDERFFVYFEEVDFSFRAINMGWRSVYLTSTQAFHAGGGSSNQVKSRRLFYSLRSRLHYVFKHFSIPEFLLVMLVTLVVEPVSRSVFVLLKGGSLKETWFAYGMLVGWMFKSVLKRLSVK